MRRFLGALLLALLFVLPAWGQSTLRLSETSHKQPAASTFSITTAAAQTGVDTTGYAIARFTIAGTFGSANLKLEGSTDGSTYPFTLSLYKESDCLPLRATGALTNTTEHYYAFVGGFSKVRVNATAIASGTVAATLTPTAAQTFPCLQSSLATGLVSTTDSVLVAGFSSGAPVNLIQGDTTVAINISSATTSQLVALTSGQKIYITSYKVIAGGTSNVKFTYGTGSNCGTGTTDLEGASPLTAQGGAQGGGGVGPVMIVPASQALCITSSGAVQVSGYVTYTKF